MVISIFSLIDVSKAVEVVRNVPDVIIGETAGDFPVLGFIANIVTFFALLPKNI